MSLFEMIMYIIISAILLIVILTLWFCAKWKEFMEFEKENLWCFLERCNEKT